MLIPASELESYRIEGLVTVILVTEFPNREYSVIHSDEVAPYERYIIDNRTSYVIVRQFLMRVLGVDETHAERILDTIDNVGGININPSTRGWRGFIKIK